jgi:hypothetical protein
VTPTRLKVNIAIGLGLIALALILDPFIDGGIWQRIIVGIAALGAGSFITHSVTTYRYEQKQHRKLEADAEVYDKHRRGL